MKEKILNMVTNRLNEIATLKNELENTTKKIEEKELEIHDFIKKWKEGCKHVFYKVQEVGILQPRTLGYYCCLCGHFESLNKQNSTNYHNRFPYTPYTISPIFDRRYRRPRTLENSAPKESEKKYDFISTINVCPFSMETANFPVPNEYQEEVNNKKIELRRLKQDKDSLIEEKEKLKESICSATNELNDIYLLLRAYLG